MVHDHSCADVGPQSCCRTLTSDQLVGLKFIILFSFCSLSAVFATLALYVIRVVKSVRYTSSPVFLKTDIDAYFLSLLVSDMLVALSGILNWKWVNEGRTSCGAFCSTQGGLEHIGMPAVALSTLAIALHTFFVIFFRWTPPRTRVIGSSVLISMWTFLVLLILIPALNFSSGDAEFLYKPSPAWCYIGASHIALRAGASYAFAWFAALISGIVYGLLFLRLRGTLRGGRDQGGVLGRYYGWWRGSPDVSRAGDRQLPERGRGGTGEDGDLEGRGTLEARKMLWYPFCYIIIILPLSVTRWMSFTEHSSKSSIRHEVPFGVIAAAASLFKLGGLIDVVLFSFTRPNVLLVGSRQGNDGLANLWSNRWPRRVRNGSQNNARVGELSNEIEMSNMAASGTGARIEGEVEEYVRGMFRSHLTPSHTRRERPGPGRRLGLVVDLSDELDYYSSTGSGTSVHHFSTEASAGNSDPGGVPLFSPLRLNLPDPRLSGLSKFGDIESSPWIQMQREEHLVHAHFSQSSNQAECAESRTIESLEFSSSTKLSPDNEVPVPSSFRSVLPSNAKPSGLSPRYPHEIFRHDGKGLSYSPDSGDSSGGQLLPETLEPLIGDQLPGRSSLEGQIDTSLRLQHSVSDAPASRERLLRGPCSSPGRKSTASPISAGRELLPVRPTIDIPSTSAHAPLSNLHCGTRSPRIRYSASPLESIPEHRLVDYFWTTHPRFPHSTTPTSPLSFRANQTYTRQRSLSDGANTRSRVRSTTEMHAENGAGHKYNSFIDMS